MTRDGDGDDTALVVALLLVVAFFGGGRGGLGLSSTFLWRRFLDENGNGSGSAASYGHSLPHTCSPRG